MYMYVVVVLSVDMGSFGYGRYATIPCSSLPLDVLNGQFFPPLLTGRWFMRISFFNVSQWIRHFDVDFSRRRNTKRPPYSPALPHITTKRITLVKDKRNKNTKSNIENRDRDANGAWVLNTTFVSSILSLFLFLSFSFHPFSISFSFVYSIWFLIPC